MHFTRAPRDALRGAIALAVEVIRSGVDWGVDDPRPLQDLSIAFSPSPKGRAYARLRELASMAEGIEEALECLQ